jgi:hypothetical protein
MFLLIIIIYWFFQKYFLPLYFIDMCFHYNASDQILYIDWNIFVCSLYSDMVHVSSLTSDWISVKFEGLH